MTVVLKGQRELISAFSRAGKDAKKYIRTELVAVAEPVAHDAEALAVEGIRKIGPRWSRMRIGVTQRSVYVVPRQSGGKGVPGRRRPNLAGLLMDRAMAPALEQNASEIAAGVDRALVHIERDWGID